MIEALILGLIGSLHCVGMCGPIALAVPVRQAQSRFFTAIQYNLGRIIAYAFLGLTFGIFGKGLSLSGVQQWVSVIAGLLLILSVFIPTLVQIKSAILKPLAWLYDGVKKQLSTLFKSQSKIRLLAIGFLNGLLPCGLVYIALVGALLSANIYDAVVYMVFFGICTSPALAALIFASKLISADLKQRLSKIIPVFIVLLGLLFILRGLGLGIPYLSPNTGVLHPQQTEQSCH